MNLILISILYFNIPEAYLRKLPARKLVDYAPKTLTPEDARKNIGLPFVPSIEENWSKSDWEGDTREEPLITQHPLTLLKSGSFNKLPYITGFNSHEAMLFLRSKSFHLLFKNMCFLLNNLNFLLR